MASLERRIDALELVAGGAAGGVRAGLRVTWDQGAVTYELNGEPVELEALPKLAQGCYWIFSAGEAPQDVIDQVKAQVVERVGEAADLFIVVYDDDWGGRHRPT